MVEHGMEANPRSATAWNDRSPRDYPDARVSGWRSMAQEEAKTSASFGIRLDVGCL